MTKNDNDTDDIEQVLEELNQSDKPLTHADVADRLGISLNEAGSLLSELVVSNKASVNADWEYRSIGAETE